MDPIQKFQKWYTKELNESDSIIPSACCLSTIGLDGYPNARYVSLKKVTIEGFVITGPVNSMKWREISQIPKVALTFWWPCIKKQIRIQGIVSMMNPTEANKYFHQRTREAQIISSVCQHGSPYTDIGEIRKRIDDFSNLHMDKEIPRPEQWGGFTIIPDRIEFMVFSADRFHERVLYSKNNNSWEGQFIQP